MISLHDAPGEEGTRSDGAESAELVDEMRLVVVAGLLRHPRPIDLPLQRQGSDGLLEALHAMKELGREAHLFAEDAAETAFAETDSCQHVGNGLGRFVFENADRVSYSAVKRQRTAKMANEEHLQKGELLPDRRRGDEAPANLSCARAENQLARKLRVVEFLRRHRQKWKGSAGAEKHADNGGSGQQDSVRRRPRPAENAAGQSGDSVVIDLFEEMDLVLGQVDDQMRTAIGKDCLLQSGGGGPVVIAAIPE